jgi:hypothetical protein
MQTISLRHAIAALAMAGAFAMPSGGAQAQEFGQSVFKRIFGVDDDQPAINYSERAPLVLPKNSQLPDPMSKAALADDPNWPKDPDAEKRKKKNANGIAGPASGNTELVSQDELALGTRQGPYTQQKSANQLDQEYEHMSNPVNPKVLARRGSFAPDSPPLDPTVCPARRTLVDPPGCINKPLASAPLDSNEPLPSEVSAEENKPWYQKIWKFGGGGD